MKKHLPIALAGLMVLALASSALAAAPKERTERPRRPASSQAAPHYDITYQIHIPTFADVVAPKIEEAFEREIARQRGPEDQQAIRKQFLENVQAAVMTAVKELDDVTLGWKLDRQEKRTYLDLRVTAVPGSGLAKRFGALKELKTAFAGFKLEGAALAAHAVGQMPADEAQRNVKLIQLAREQALKKIEEKSAPEKEIMKDLASKLFDVIEGTAASGRSDGALSVVVKPDQVTLVAAGYVADGPKLESVVKPVAQYLKEHHPAFASFKADAEQYQGVNLHTLAIPAPQGDDRERFVKVFGESLDVVIGFGKEAVYVAAGKDAMKTLKAAIDKSKTPAAVANPLEVSLALQPIAETVAALGRDHERAPAEMVNAMLKQTPGKDHLRLVVEPIDRGAVVRIEVEQGILELIGSVNADLRKFLLGQ